MTKPGRRLQEGEGLQSQIKPRASGMADGCSWHGTESQDSGQDGISEITVFHLTDKDTYR